MNAAANAAAAAASASMNAWALYANTTVGAAKIAADAEADASEAFTLSAIDHFLQAVADQAAAEKTATKDIAADQADAVHDSVSASQTRATDEANTAKDDADAKIDAAQEASNGVVDLIYVYNVASIGVGLLATTTATGFALLRENGGITAVSSAQRDAINAGYTKAIADLAADLVGRNANEAFDDPIAIAAATNSAKAGVREAWQNVSNLRARAAETFAGMGPGGFAMTVAGFIGGVSDAFRFAWDGLTDGNYIHHLTNPSLMDQDLRIIDNAAKGVFVGAITAAGIVVAAPLLIAGGTAMLTAGGLSAATATTVSGGTVTGGVFLLGAGGGLNLYFSSLNAYREGNWDQLSYNAGLLIGGLIVGGHQGRALVYEMTGRPSPAPVGFWAQVLHEGASVYRPGGEFGFFSFSFWATAPTPLSGAGAVGLGSGVNAN